MTRSFLAPEVLQISTMDCGVAALSCMLAGHGVPVSYEKLREACQTSVDGTNIDALEGIANDLGLDVMQHLVPSDLLWDVASRRVPAIAVAQRHEASLLHFLTVWGTLSSRVQVMDPAGGRRWPSKSSFESELYVHSLVMSIDDWKVWMSTSTFRDALEARAKTLVSSKVMGETVGPVLAAMDPRSVSSLEASVRLLTRVVQTSGVKSADFRDELFVRAFRAGLEKKLPPNLHAITVRDATIVSRGVLLLAPVDETDANPDTQHIATRAVELGFAPKSVTKIWDEVWALLGRDGRKLAGAVSLGTLGLAVASALELLLYRAIIDAPRLFTTARLRLGVVALGGSLMLALGGLEILLSLGGSRLARRLELAVRARTLYLFPRVHDEFIQSRPTPDLAYRAHGLAQAGSSISTMQSAVSAPADFAITLIAIGLLDRKFALIAAIGGVLFVLVERLFRPRLQELDTRLQVSASRLLSVLLDSLRGSRPIRLHGFQHALRNTQIEEIGRWKDSAEIQFDTMAALSATYSILSTLLTFALFAVFLLGSSDPRSFVLLALWSLRLPSAIQRLVSFAQTFPQQKNSLMRILEITRQPPLPDPAIQPIPAETRGMSVAMRDVQVITGGNVVLQDLNLDIPAGQHIAIVGPSGSGKSTLVGLMLGLQRAAKGQIWIDGVRVDENRVRELRPQIAWMDPAVQLWNSSVSENLEYASIGRAQRPRLSVLEDSDLLGVLGSLERGLDTPVGAEGAFLSGGEGQRLRLARALLPAGVRLAILDEAFRGLERKVREQLASRIRVVLARSTVLFVSHDVRQALSFERVLVVEDARIVEDGVPAELASQDTRFAAMLAAEREMLERTWGNEQWRRVRVADGTIEEANNASS